MSGERERQGGREKERAEGEEDNKRSNEWASERERLVDDDDDGDVDGESTTASSVCCCMAFPHVQIWSSHSSSSTVWKRLGKKWKKTTRVLSFPFFSFFSSSFLKGCLTPHPLATTPSDGWPWWGGLSALSLSLMQHNTFSYVRYYKMISNAVGHAVGPGTTRRHTTVLMGWTTI